MDNDFSRMTVFSGYCGFLPNKTDRHDITEILLKVAFIHEEEKKALPSSNIIFFI
jgi:hypothetical protein